MSRRHLGARQRGVLAAIGELRRAGMRPSDTDIAGHLNLPISWIVPRRRELYELGEVVKGGTKCAETRRTVAWWKPAAGQLDLSAGMLR